MNRALACFLLLAAALSAQTNRGGIAGTVTDKSGAVVPCATVVITSTGTNQASKITTSGSGAYALQNLEPVVYRVEVTAGGFRKAITDQVKVDTASTTTVNVQREMGGVETTVAVSAAVPLINTESGAAGQTVTAQQIDNSPLVNRSVLDLALTIPNVTGDAGSEDPGLGAGAPVPGYNLTVNRGRAGSTLTHADGANNTGVGTAGALRSFSPEKVQQFPVATNASPAEFSL